MRYTIIAPVFILVLSIFIMSCGSTKNTPKTRKTNQNINPERQAIIEARNGNYNKAIAILDEEIKKYPNDLNLQLRKITYQFEGGNQAEAYNHLQQILKVNQEIDPEAYFTAGIMANKLNEYDAAAQHFKSFVKKGQGTTQRLDRARELAKKNQFLASYNTEDETIQPRPVAGEINTLKSEYLPSLTLDQSQLLFTRNLGKHEDLFVASYDNGKWVNVSPINSINTEGNEGGQTIAADGKTIIFTACQRKFSIGGCDLYMSRKTKDGWSTPKILNENINTPVWESQPSLSADGKKLFFSSSRVEGLGDRDIWMSTLNDEGSWNPAINLGSSINTKGSEQSPFLHPDGVTLYFRSNGHLGFGGMDIFKSTYDPINKKWSKAVNLGPGINTEGDEGALTIAPDGKTAFYASDIVSLRDENVPNNLDIMTFELPERHRSIPTSYIKARVFDSKTKQPLSAKALLENQNNDTSQEVMIDESGELLMALPAGITHTLSFDKPGYFYALQLIDAYDANTYMKPLIVNIYLDPIPSAYEDDVRPIVLNNIYFKSGSAELLNESQFEIQKLTEFMRDLPKINIKILGHTDNVGEEADNIKLSEDRAAALAQALVDNGIAKQRIIAIGLGESNPIASNETPEGRALNRRTEIIILYNK